jgi:putative heme utilization carrier protein HutX
MNIHVSELQAKLAADPGVVVESFAKEHGATPLQVIDALPADMRRFAEGSHFVEVMQQVAGWGDVTVIVHTEDGIMEFGGPVPAGEVGRGYYNLSGSKGFHGHLRHERCTKIAFVERPFFGRLSASVLFFNGEGGIMFKIFVGRDDKRELIASQHEAFRGLASRLCANG